MFYNSGTLFIIVSSNKYLLNSYFMLSTRGVKIQFLPWEEHNKVKKKRRLQNKQKMHLRFWKTDMIVG